jgi:hypothetical protein
MCPLQQTTLPGIGGASDGEFRCSDGRLDVVTVMGHLFDARGDIAGAGFSS